MASRMTIPMASGIAKASPAMPAAARTNIISWGAYATEDIASDEKTARPITLLIAWCGASAVARGRPMSQVESERRGLLPAVRCSTPGVGSWSVGSIVF